MGICLHQLLVKCIIDYNYEFALLINETGDTYSCILRGETTIQTVVTSSAVSKIHELFNKKKSEVSAQSKTTMFCQGYQQMLGTARGRHKYRLCCVLNK